MLTRSNARAALLGRDSKKRCPLLAPRCRYDSAGEWPGLGPDRLELLRVRLEYSCRAEPFQMQQRVLVAMQLIQIRRDQHLIIKPGKLDRRGTGRSIRKIVRTATLPDPPGPRTHPPPHRPRTP